MMDTTHGLSLAPSSDSQPEEGESFSMEAGLTARIATLEQRLVKIEAEQKKFMEALVYAGKFLMENPASKMILMSLPKEMKTRLTEFFAKVK
jgi:hypothetical protein